MLIALVVVEGVTIKGVAGEVTAHLDKCKMFEPISLGFVLRRFLQGISSWSRSPRTLAVTGLLGELITQCFLYVGSSPSTSISSSSSSSSSSGSTSSTSESARGSELALDSRPPLSEKSTGRSANRMS